LKRPPDGNTGGRFALEEASIMPLKINNPQGNTI
jgi:hypothetical protein